MNKFDKLVNFLLEASDRNFWAYQIQGAKLLIKKRMLVYYNVLEQFNLKLYDENEPDPSGQRTMFVSVPKKLIGVFIDFLKKIYTPSLAEIATILSHEVLHVIFNHHERGLKIKAYDTETKSIVWNIACDIWINWQLLADNFIFPKGEHAPLSLIEPDGEFTLKAKDWGLTKDFTISLYNYKRTEQLYEDILTLIRVKDVPLPVIDETIKVGDIIWNKKYKAYAIVLKISNVGGIDIYEVEKMTITEAVKILQK